MKRIFLYDMDRVLLIFLLLANLESDEIIYVTYEDKKDKLKYLSGTKLILENSRMYSNYSFLNRFKMSWYIKELRKANKGILEAINRDEIELYGMDNLELGKRLFFDEKINVIEEGLLNYMPYNVKENLKKSIIKNIILFIFGLKERKDLMGYGDLVKKVYFTKGLCEEIPEKLKTKAEILDLKELWDKKSTKEKEIIKNTFGFDEKILEVVKGNTTMLFTQPISEDGILSEDEKIEIYRKIIEKYPNEKIIIKPHPREKTDYSKCFPSCYVMKEKYPIELLTVMGVDITRAVTLFSTAAFGLGKDVKIDFYGSEVNEKLLKRFGSCDKIMKRNAFI